MKDNIKNLTNDEILEYCSYNNIILKYIDLTVVPYKNILHSALKKNYDWFIDFIHLNKQELDKEDFKVCLDNSNMICFEKFIKYNFKLDNEVEQYIIETLQVDYTILDFLMQKNKYDSNITKKIFMIHKKGLSNLIQGTPIENIIRRLNIIINYDDSYLNYEDKLFCVRNRVYPKLNEEDLTIELVNYSIINGFVPFTIPIGHSNSNHIEITLNKGPKFLNVVKNIIASGVELTNELLMNIYRNLKHDNPYYNYKNYINIIELFFNSGMIIKKFHVHNNYYDDNYCNNMIMIFNKVLKVYDVKKNNEYIKIEKFKLINSTKYKKMNVEDRLFALNDIFSKLNFNIDTVINKEKKENNLEDEIFYEDLLEYKKSLKYTTMEKMEQELKNNKREKRINILFNDRNIDINKKKLNVVNNEGIKLLNLKKDTQLSFIDTRKKLIKYIKNNGLADYNSIKIDNNLSNIIGSKSGMYFKFTDIDLVVKKFFV